MNWRAEMRGEEIQSGREKMQKRRVTWLFGYDEKEQEVQQRNARQVKGQ